MKRRKQTLFSAFLLGIPPHRWKPEALRKAFQRRTYSDRERLAAPAPLAEENLPPPDVDITEATKTREITLKLRCREKFCFFIPSLKIHRRAVLRAPFRVVEEREISFGMLLEQAKVAAHGCGARFAFEGYHLYTFVLALLRTHLTLSPCL